MKKLPGYLFERMLFLDLLNTFGFIGVDCKKKPVRVNQKELRNPMFESLLMANCPHFATLSPILPSLGAS